MSGLPSGTVTFLFTDIEGSTTRWEAHPEQMREALARHDAILRSAIEDNGGHVFKTVGDAFCAAFSSPLEGIHAAHDAQWALHSEAWPEEIGRIRVRMALHTSAVDLQDGDYFGQPVNRVARILSSGHGGQVLLSEAVYSLVRDNLPGGATVTDMGEHRLKDLIRPERIFQLQAPGLPFEFPPLKTLDSWPNNLPLQLTSLVGREKEVEVVAALLRHSDVRLVTLTGPGGTGKTRLALHVGAELLNEYPDGVWLVELAPLADPNLVAPTIAQVLGVTEGGGRPVADTVAEYLKFKHLLLILDNFEQVMDAIGVITAILKSAANAKVLVTSRVKLNVYGEHDYEVPPLLLPDLRRGHLPAAERLSQYEAVRLFIERAQAARADFQVTNENAPAVAEICVKLDGLPLAIELAAARVKMLSPQALLTRLSQRLKLLTGGSRDLPARQQTLRGAIDWSYDLLSPGERQLFWRMAVFQGGRTLEALETVCNRDGDLQIDVLDGVQSLLDKSLIQQREGSGGEPRFWMLETIQEFAREKLQESGEEEELRRTHALFFVDLAQEADPRTREPGHEQWIGLMEQEHDNFRAALRWSLDRGESEIACTLGGDLSWFWCLRGYYTEGRAWLQETLSRRSPGDGTPPGIAAKALLGLGHLWLNQASLQVARPLLEESLALFRQAGDKWGMSEALNNLGNAASFDSDVEEAMRNYEESLAIRRELGKGEDIAFTIQNMGEISRLAGDYERARALYEEALLVSRASKSTMAQTYILLNLGQVEQHYGEQERADSLYREGLALSWDLKVTNEVVAAYLVGMAGTAAWNGEPERGARLFGAADAWRETIGGIVEPADRPTYDGNMAAVRGQLSDEAWQKAYAEGRATAIEQAVAYALEAVPVAT